MATLDNLGYNTYVLGTIKAVTESKKIIVYDRNVFKSADNYSRLNLYNLSDIFFDLLYEGNGVYNEHCFVIERSDNNEDTPFVYDCSNSSTGTSGFNIIVYISGDNTPTGYTEFINTQGRLSEYIWIYLRFKIEVNSIELKLNNSLYKSRNRLSRSFLGTEISKFPSSSQVRSRINKIPKDQKYTSHLSNFLRPNNTSNIFLYDRTILQDGSITKIDLIHDANIFDGEEYSNYQIGYYQDTIVLYAWTFVDDDIGYYYRITSLLDQVDYKCTRRIEGGELKDIVTPYSNKEVSKELLYGAGKYLVFKISYTYGGIVALFDTSNDSWIYSDNPNVVVDPFDKKSIIHELPKYTSIQTYDTALDLFPEVSDIFLDLKEYMKRSHCLDIVKKFGDWFVIRDYSVKNVVLYLFTCPSMSVYMTLDEYRNCTIINNNTLIINDSDYYIVYHGPQKQTYYTEKARCIINKKPLTDIELGNNTIKVCDNSYIDKYRNSEIAIVFKNLPIYNSILDSYRRQPTYTYEVPDKIIGAMGGIIYYIKNNSINYI